MGPTLVSFVVEVCRLGFEPQRHSSPPLSHSENADADRTGIFELQENMKITGREVWAIRWMMIETPPSRIPARDVLTVKPCLAVDLAQLTMNFDRRYALSIQKLYRIPNFNVGGC